MKDTFRKLSSAMLLLIGCLLPSVAALTVSFGALRHDIYPPCTPRLAGEPVCMRLDGEPRMNAAAAMKPEEKAVCLAAVSTARCAPEVLRIPGLHRRTDSARGSERHGTESTSRVVCDDQGCTWTETAETVSVDICLKGLRGQPAGCLAVHLAASRDYVWRGRGTASVSAFGQVVWSCVMRGAIVVDACSTEVADGGQMLPIIRITVRKLPEAAPWEGFIEEIEYNTLM